MAELTPKAEALNDLVNNTIDHGIVSDHLTEDITDNVFRTIREELGITELDVLWLRKRAEEAARSLARIPGMEGRLPRDTRPGRLATTCSTLLELAAVDHGK